jgi:hypothetical protein
MVELVNGTATKKKLKIESLVETIFCGVMQRSRYRHGNFPKVSAQNSFSSACGQRMREI